MKDQYDLFKDLIDECLSDLEQQILKNMVMYWVNMKLTNNAKTNH